MEEIRSIIEAIKAENQREIEEYKEYNKNMQKAVDKFMQNFGLDSSNLSENENSLFLSWCGSQSWVKKSAKNLTWILSEILSKLSL